jgi:hypothetical protein
MEIEVDRVVLEGCAVAQAVSRRPLADEAWVTCHVGQVTLLPKYAFTEWTRKMVALRLRALDYPGFRFQLSLLRYLLS